MFKKVSCPMRKLAVLPAAAALVLGLAGFFGMPMQARAELLFTTDKSTWESLVTGEVSYAFTRSNVEKANEVVPLGEGNNITFLGGGSENLTILTFDKINTGLPVNFVFRSTQPPTGSGFDGYPGFTFNDIFSADDPMGTIPSQSGSPPAPFIDALSVGEIDYNQKDDWEMTFSGGDIFAFAVDLRANGFDCPSPDCESFSVFGASGSLGSTTTIPTGDSAFLGVISYGDPITKVVFEEDPGNDDIAVGGIQLATTVVLAPQHHYNAYEVRSEAVYDGGGKRGNELNIDVTLEDQFGDSLLTVAKAKLLLVPVYMNGEGIGDEVTHLVCYELKNPDGKGTGVEPKEDVTVVNQFNDLAGDQVMEVKKLKMLCVPSTYLLP